MKLSCYGSNTDSSVICFSVIALDLKGFGDSDKPLSRRSYKLEIILEELTIFISSLGITRLSVVGHDIGALLGWYLVHLNPDLVAKFVAISCPHPNIYWDELPKNSRFNQKYVMRVYVLYCFIREKSNY